MGTHGLLRWYGLLRRVPTGRSEGCPQAAPMGTHRSVPIGAAVSLVIPGMVVSLEIPVSRFFLVKISGKIVKIGFSDSRDQNKILKF